METIKTRAAVLTGPHRPFEIVELDLERPRTGEVLIRYVAAGMCHSDLHLTDGDIVPRYPLVAGHEGSGIIEEVGVGVTSVQPGDHVVCSYLPTCGRCRYCATGRQNLCDTGATMTEGVMPDGTFRLRRGGTEYGAFSMLGTFSQFGTISERSVVKVDGSLPLETAVIVGCGVPTGWGSAVHAGNVRAGDTVVVYGVGGIGINAVQGAVHAGAQYVVAVDPIEFKRDTARRLGATHAFPTAEEARRAVVDLTRGQGADQALVTVGVVDESVVSAAFAVIGKGGTLVLTGLAHPDSLTIHVSGAELTLYEKTIRGTIFGSGNPAYDIPKMLSLYQSGDLCLDELVTRRYSLDEVNQGYQDLVDGKLIRGVVVIDPASAAISA
jgi:S-(hydroxymethyl)glutathione dehydrogenase/alcohol dehydrogenase